MGGHTQPVIVTGLVCALTVGASQPDAPGTQARTVIDRATTRADGHTALDPLVGSWEGTVRTWSAPGSTPSETRGAVTRTWVLDGRYLREEVREPGEPGRGGFEGVSFIGYNTLEDRYETVWLENRSTYMSASTGTYDAAARRFTFLSDRLDPVSGRRSRGRTVLEVVGPDRTVIRGWALGPDGREFQYVEGVMDRVPAGGSTK